jgi:lysyl-tRNA synthetase class II
MVLPQEKRAAEKAAAKAVSAPASSSKSKPPGSAGGRRRAGGAGGAGGGAEAAADDEVDPTAYFENRQAAMDELECHGTSPYPHVFKPNTSIPEFLQLYARLPPDSHVVEDRVAVAGRLMLIRSSSAKLHFFAMQADGAKVQIMMNYKVHALAEESSKSARDCCGSLIGNAHALAVLRGQVSFRAHGAPAASR